MKYQSDIKAIKRLHTVNTSQLMMLQVECYAELVERAHVASVNECYALTSHCNVSARGNESRDQIRDLIILGPGQDVLYQPVNQPEVNMRETMDLVETHRNFQNKLVVKDRHTVEFSGRVFQTVDSLLMVQVNQRVPLSDDTHTQTQRK